MPIPSSLPGVPMAGLPPMRGVRAVLLAALAGATSLGTAQQGAPGEGSLASVAVEGVTLSGPLLTSGGRASLGNNSTVSAGDRSAELTLARGGALRVCASTSVHLSRDAAPLAAAGAGARGDDAGLMVALDRGALEAHYTTGKYSDVILTPDLRILVSGPGTANLKLRVNRQGDTCVDNHGTNAPYVTVSSLMDGGVYRVQPDQRVLFEHGSLQQVVDREAEACGCPDAVPPSAAAEGGGAKPLGGPSSTPADTAFPTAVSEGLAQPPGAPQTPVVPAGQAHAQVTATLSSETPPGSAPEGASPTGASGTGASGAGVAAPTGANQPRRGLFGSIGHFFARVFRRGG